MFDELTKALLSARDDVRAWARPARDWMQDADSQIMGGIRHYLGPHAGPPVQAALKYGPEMLGPGADVRDMTGGSSQLAQALMNRDYSGALEGGALMAGGAAAAVLPGPSVSSMKRGVDEVVDALPMDEASRMARAEGMFPIEGYHGTANDVSEFDPRKAGGVTKARSAKLGTWLTASPETAAGYAELAEGKAVQDLIDASYAAEGRGQWDNAHDLMAQAERLEQSGGAGGGNIMPLRAGGNIKEIDMDGAKYDPDDVDLTKLAREAKAEGFDGVRFQNMSDEAGYGAYHPTDHILIFDPKNIRSRFAKFDPAKRDSRDLLAGLAMPVAAGSALALALQSYRPEGERQQ